jgi:glyoxylase-like metal-dependent hydrolase (beta-lactamase superfamily II)
MLNVYALDLADGSLGLVDCGWDCEDSRRSLVAELGEIGRRLEDVSRIAVTHSHPDHIGLAHHIQDVAGSTVFAHEVEVARLAEQNTGPRGYEQAALTAFPRWGVPAVDMDQWVGSSANILAQSWDVACTGLSDGQRLDFPGWELDVVWTPGHTPGHMCLVERDAGVLMTGDHVLPRITPVVGAHPADEADPLADFLASLELVSQLGVDRALPAHEGIFVGIPERVEELRAHHEARLEEVANAVKARPRASAWEVAQVLTWSRPLGGAAGPTRRLALAETQAHLVHLEARGTVARTHNDVERWTPA